MPAHWYVCHTKPNAERQAFRRLREQCFEAYLPMLRALRIANGRKSELIAPLFPGYLFLLLDLERDEAWKSIGFTKGVISLLPSTEWPLPIERRQVRDLLYKENSGAFRTGHGIHAGDDVRVIAGSLADQVLHCIASRGDRIRCLWNCLGAQRVVDVPLSNVYALR